MKSTEFILESIHSMVSSDRSLSDVIDFMRDFDLEIMSVGTI